MLVKAARSGDYMMCFDINAAFLNADIDVELLICLPLEFAKPGESRYKKLVKAIYGLPQSPLKWFQKYAEGLALLGWQQCANEAAMWRRPSQAVKGQYLKLTVYVDDNILTGPNLNEAIHATNEILKSFDGKVIQPEFEGNVLLWGVLGAQLHYNQAERTMKLSMEHHIVKMAEKLTVKSCSSSQM